MKAYEAREKILKIDKCPKCNCNVADDWEYVDFSNKNVIECPQCNEHFFLEK